MIDKLKKLEHPTVFYADIAYSTGLVISTVTKWFNYTHGIKIPEKHEKTVIKLLDERLEFYEKVKEIENKYPNLKF
jgi:hypothetical protein